MTPEEWTIDNLIKDTTTATWTNHPGWITLGYDIENRSSLLPNKEHLLLSAFCNNDTPGKEEVLVIDNTSVNNAEVFPQEVLNRCLFISHNADHEARWGVATNFLPMRFACTMVNSHRLHSGMEGLRYDLVSEINRTLGYGMIPEWMDKDIRSEFATIQFFEDRHILYNAADTIRLKMVYAAQKRRAEELGQSFLLNTINSRIIIPIAEAEMTGIAHDSEGWIGIAEKRQQDAEKICQELDQVILEQFKLNPTTINPEARKKHEQKERKEIRDKTRLLKLEEQLKRLESQNKTHLKSYKVSLENYQKLLSITQELVEEESGSVNWGSSKQVLEVLKQIQCPPPESKDKVTKKLKPGVSKEARANWFVNNEGSQFEFFIKKFDKFKKIEHNIKSFGKKWVLQYVINGRVYTLLHQSGTDTGRFSSGDKGKVKRHPNMQQIPKEINEETKKAHYRQCFIADPGRTMLVADYNNCEGVIMISQSGDLNMKKITSLADQHSYLGTLCWRAVYMHRYNRTKDPKWKELAETYEMNQSTPEKKKERTVFKNSGGLFPVAYGVFASKVAGSAKITIDEGQVMIDTIKAQIPLVIKYLDGVSAKALQDGYAVHNTRTGSRRWFQKVLDHQLYGWELSKGDIIEIQSASRNTVIQGTNSDLIKEAIAMLALWKKLFKVDVRFLLTVHDELVVDCPDDQVEFIKDRLEKIMERAAKNYLIKEIDMKVECKSGKTWGD